MAQLYCYYFISTIVWFSSKIKIIMPSQQQERIRLSSMGGESTCSNSSSGGSGSGSTTMKIRRRVVMMGAARVGKTSIIKQFLYDQFPDRYKETIEELHRGEWIIFSYKNLSFFILNNNLNLFKVIHCNCVDCWYNYIK